MWHALYVERHFKKSLPFFINFLRYSYKFLDFGGFSDDPQKLEMHSSYKLQCDLFFTIITDFGYVTGLTGNITIPVQQLMLEGLYHLDELENNDNSIR